MLKLILGEAYRLLHKKSMYIYFASLAVGYFLLAFIRSGGFGEESIVSDAMTFFNLLPPIAGGFLFSAIYTDDLRSKNLIALVGFGISKARIVIAKFILTVLFGAFIFGLAPVLHVAVYAALGFKAATGVMGTVYAVALLHLLTTIAFSALSGIAVYGLQRATFAIVLYILLAFGVISSLLSMAFEMFAPSLTDHMMFGITYRLLAGITSDSPLIAPVIEYIAYSTAALALSVLAFYKKEMEF